MVSRASPSASVLRRRTVLPRASSLCSWPAVRLRGMEPPRRGGTVLLLAKHVNPDLISKVLWTDIASTIEGGKDATAGEECGAAGRVWDK